MKTILVTFDDDDFALLNEVKGETTWREFILTLVTPKVKR